MISRKLNQNTFKPDLTTFLFAQYNTLYGWIDSLNIIDKSYQFHMLFFMPLYIYISLLTKPSIMKVKNLKIVGDGDLNF